MSGGKKKMPENNGCFLFPARAYEAHLKADFARRAEEMLEETVLRSGVNASRNRRMAAKYRRIRKRIQKQADKVHVTALAEKLSPRYVQYLQKKGESILAECKEQMQPLLSMLDDKMTYDLVRETLPEFRLDESFDAEAQARCRKILAQSLQDTPDISTVGVLSGSFRGHPFLVETRKIFFPDEAEFSEDQTISWDKEEEPIRVRRRSDYQERALVAVINIIDEEMGPRVETEQLHASVRKPVPGYQKSTRLLYGFEEMPELSFLHTPEVFQDSTTRNPEFVILTPANPKGSKMPRREADDFSKRFFLESCTDAGQFSALIDEKARGNLLELMRDGSPYGDDFYFEKSKNVTVIESVHGQEWELSTNTEAFASYDLREIREKFLKRNSDFFAQFYFAFAPILCIPAYCRTQSAETAMQPDETEALLRNAEILANSFAPSVFGHEKSETELLLKCRLLGTEDGVSRFEVTAKSYRTERKKEAVDMTGSDGLTYRVLVPYPEYHPLEKVTEMEVRRLHMTDEAFRRSRFHADSRPHVYVHDWYAVAGKTVSAKTEPVYAAQKKTTDKE